MTSIRILAAIHGYFGVLSAAALLHPAIVMRRGQQLSRGSRWAVLLATAFAVATFSTGIVIYEDYRGSVKRGLFALKPSAGYLFETKEHLAFAAVCLALGGCLCSFAAPREARELRRAAAAAYLTAALLATTVAILGTYVTAVKGFPE